MVPRAVSCLAQATQHCTAATAKSIALALTHLGQDTLHPSRGHPPPPLHHSSNLQPWPSIWAGVCGPPSSTTCTNPVALLTPAALHPFHEGAQPPDLQEPPAGLQLQCSPWTAGPLKVKRGSQGQRLHSLKSPRENTGGRKKLGDIGLRRSQRGHAGQLGHAGQVGQGKSDVVQEHAVATHPLGVVMGATGLVCPVLPVPDTHHATPCPSPGN